MQIRDSIHTLKKERGALILAHNYQLPQIQDIADYVGDSLELAKVSMKLPSKTLVFCGVLFMAETAKILSPQKQVLLPAHEAGCPLADTIASDELSALKRQHPGAWVVSYVNSSARIKALSDICCTSSNAVTVVKNVPSEKVLFVPDKNLGWWVQKNVPEKEVISWNGYCYVHERFTLADLERARSEYPDGVIIVHPECRKEILERADYVVSTAGMLKVAREVDKEIFIIGTEEGMLYRLQKENPKKRFLSLGNTRICLNMKKTTLETVEEALRKQKYIIELEQDVMRKAKKALDEMVRFV